MSGLLSWEERAVRWVAGWIVIGCLWVGAWLGNEEASDVLRELNADYERAQEDEPEGGGRR